MPTRRYSPRSSVTSVNCRPVARSTALTVTPGRTAFDSSTTVPTIVASTCANAGAAPAATMHAAIRRRVPLAIILPSFDADRDDGRLDARWLYPESQFAAHGKTDGVGSCAKRRTAPDQTATRFGTDAAAWEPAAAYAASSSDFGPSGWLAASSASAALLDSGREKRKPCAWVQPSLCSSRA